MFQKPVIIGALLPPAFRSMLSYRIFNRLASKADLPEFIIGNMGISSDLRCLIPSDDSLLLFGRPDDYRGERGALELCGELSRQAESFVDIGAHKGYFSFFVRHRAGNDKPIYLFEPDELLFGVLNENITRNGDRRMRPFKRAVGSFNGNATFYRNISSPLSGSLKEDFKADHEIVETEVSVCTYHQFAQEENIQNACVKVDIENSEFDFIKGANESLGTIRFLIMEVLGPAVQQGFIPEMINEYGYHAYYIDDYCLRYSSEGGFDYQPPQYNWLFCRENPDQLRRLIATNNKLEVIG